MKPIKLTKQSIPNLNIPKPKQLPMFADIHQTDPIKGTLWHSKKGSVWVVRIKPDGTKVYPSGVPYDKE